MPLQQHMYRMPAAASVQLRSDNMRCTFLQTVSLRQGHNHSHQVLFRYGKPKVLPRKDILYDGVNIAVLEVLLAVCHMSLMTCCFAESMRW